MDRTIPCPARCIRKILEANFQTALKIGQLRDRLKIQSLIRVNALLHKMMNYVETDRVSQIKYPIMKEIKYRSMTVCGSFNMKSPENLAFAVTKSNHKALAFHHNFQTRLLHKNRLPLEVRCQGEAGRAVKLIYTLKASKIRPVISKS
jgi:hypothetical protein